MKCQHCQYQMEKRSRTCPACGHRQGFLRPSIIYTVLAPIALFTTFYFLFPFPTEPASPTEVTEERLDEKTKILELARETVYTVYTEDRQGSAFLYDQKGFLITNAHVVEGSYQVSIQTVDGNLYPAKVIGYSTEIDIALLSAPKLKGTEPFPIDRVKQHQVGEEVMALGTPFGIEYTASFGYLTGVDRSFHIPPHRFNHVYQISAPIEVGNSGGPLISIQDGKIIGINTAKSLDYSHIAYSIPIHQVVDLLDQWMKKPLTEKEITAKFFHNNGQYYYDFLLSLIEHYYFEDGFYTDDEYYQDYWLYDESKDLWESYQQRFLPFRTYDQQPFHHPY